MRINKTNFVVGMMGLPAIIMTAIAREPFWFIIILITSLFNLWFAFSNDDIKQKQEVKKQKWRNKKS